MRVFLCLLTGFLYAVNAADAADAPAKLELSGLAPAKLSPDLCLVRYRVGTTVPECQAFFDQGLGYFYSYVWMEAARSFETATQRDPDCAMAWLGLSRALDKWGKSNHAVALRKAQDLLKRASHREQLLITARLQDKGMAPGVAAADRQRKARLTLDELLSLHDDDEEGWMARGALAEAPVSAVPFYKALVRLNPLHPGANHELLHFYDNGKRPALGWIYAENYLKSSPGIPHPFHMQAHLAMRLGRWDKTSDRSAHALELERAYHRDMNVKPSDDAQFAHHAEVLLLSLIHDGRFREGRALKAEVEAAGVHQWLPWFKLHRADHDWDAARAIVDHFRKSDKVTCSYLSALIALSRDDVDRATAEVEVLRHAYQEKKDDRTLENRLWETQGMLLCRQGDAGAVDAGLKLLARLVERFKNDYHQHAWGNGAYYMEEWGESALRAGRVEVAEEAFLEALAHDPGSHRAALGLHVLCERGDRVDEAESYLKLARRCWRHAEVASFEREVAALRDERYVVKVKSSVGATVGVDQGIGSGGGR